MLGFLPLATTPLGAALSTDSVGGVGTLTLPALTLVATGTSNGTPEGTAVLTLPSLTLGATGTALYIGTAALMLPTATVSGEGGVFYIGQAAAQLGHATAAGAGTFRSQWYPACVIPSWQSNGTTVSFDLADVPYIGEADDSRQIILGLVHAWYTAYTGACETPAETHIIWQPTNIGPRDTNFTWTSVVFDRIERIIEVVDET